MEDVAAARARASARFRESHDNRKRHAAALISVSVLVHVITMFAMLVVFAVSSTRVNGTVRALLDALAFIEGNQCAAAALRLPRPLASATRQSAQLASHSRLRFGSDPDPGPSQGPVPGHDEKLVGKGGNQAKMPGDSGADRAFSESAPLIKGSGVVELHALTAGLRVMAMTVALYARFLPQWSQQSAGAAAEVRLESALNPRGSTSAASDGIFRQSIADVMAGRPPCASLDVLAGRAVARERAVRSRRDRRTPPLRSTPPVQLSRHGGWHLRPSGAGVATYHPVRAASPSAGTGNLPAYSPSPVFPGGGGMSLSQGSAMPPVRTAL
eukprot:TRINITY_DN9200_c0_g1_i1.p1 TRINITY_DN9200_c0_g1~~TRINITY_DN9200_c0_g1_i1.p1  ORF type:complete len:327 (-),score=40.39 TRINITY_DN9200_c0_g1_i1:323-1303(-)